MSLRKIDWPCTSVSEEERRRMEEELRHLVEALQIVNVMSPHVEPQPKLSKDPVELVPGPLVGYRVYRFGRGRLLPLFHSAGDDSDALPPAAAGGYMPARCAHSSCEQSEGCGAPCARGSCGWYSFRDWRSATETWLDQFTVQVRIDPHTAVRSKGQELHVEALVELNDTDYLLAEVAVWGRVAVADEGYRSQYCYPMRLWALRVEQAGGARGQRQQELEAAARDYGVSLEWVPLGGELLARLADWKCPSPYTRKLWTLSACRGEDIPWAPPVEVLPAMMPASGPEFGEYLLAVFRAPRPDPLAKIAKQLQTTQVKLRFATPSSGPSICRNLGPNHPLPRRRAFGPVVSWKGKQVKAVCITPEQPPVEPPDVFAPAQLRAGRRSATGVSGKCRVIADPTVYK